MNSEELHTLLKQFKAETGLDPQEVTLLSFMLWFYEVEQMKVNPNTPRLMLDSIKQNYEKKKLIEVPKDEGG